MDWHAHPQSHCNRNADCYAHGHQFTHGHGDAYGDGHAHCYGDGYAHRHGNGNGHSDCHAHGNGYTYGNGNGNGNGHCYSHCDQLPLSRDSSGIGSTHNEEDSVKDTAKLLQTLSEANGVSGHEAPVRELIIQELGPLADEVTVDRLGNIIAVQHGAGDEPRPRIMLATHMDEIGLMVLRIEEGFLRFVTVGGFDPRVLLGQEVVVHGKQPLPGVIGSRPPHVVSKEERKKPVPLEELFIDVGLSDEQARELVQIGDAVTLAQPFIEFKGKGRLASGKAFDNRTSVIAMILALDALSRLHHTWDVYAVATVQEEVGLRGATSSAYGIAPDVAIAIDVTQGDMLGASEAETMKVGDGPAIGLGPNFHPAVHDRLVQTAKAHEIPHQIDPMPWPGGTDAAAIQMTREGIPTSLLSIPLRYMHTVVETVALPDIERTGRLLAHFIAELTDKDWLTNP